MDNETLASLLRGRNRAGQPVDATANIIGPAMSALGNTIYGAGRGALTAMAGLPGDINQLITDNLGRTIKRLEALNTMNTIVRKTSSDTDISEMNSNSTHQGQSQRKYSPYE